MKWQLVETAATVAVRHECKTGKRAVLKGVAHISSKQMVNLLTQCEKNTKSKRKTRTKKRDDIKVEDTSDEEDESVIILDEIRIEY